LNPAKPNRKGKD